MMRDAWGEPLASALIEAIPPMAPDDYATKHDIEHLGVQLRGEMSELRGEMSELRGELKGEMAALRGEFRASSRHTLVTIVAAAVSIWLTFYLPAVL
ncbi:MAG: hypothetical protein CL424_16455 [Acidimicrobiaceae bacterium]|nr:hypothetical protein [Acidimicrobiaceae bacterium]